MPAIGNACAAKIIDLLTAKNTYTTPGPLYLALTVSAVADTDGLGTTLTAKEATYGGYARKLVAAADWNAASATATATNAVQELFNACNSGTSTVIGWALCSTASGACEITHFGTCASTVISTTATPATVNASALSIGLD